MHYRHEALPYRGEEAFFSSCAQLAAGGLADDEPVMFLADSAKLDGLRDVLGTDVGRVTLVATDEHGHNPARITTLLHGFLSGQDGRRCVGVSESVSSERSGPALAEAQLAETMLNSELLQSWPMSIVCLYDMEQLDDATLHEMRRSHPVVRGEEANAAFEPELAGQLFSGRLEEPTARVESRVIGVGELAELRAFVRGTVADAGLAADRLDDLVLAANEIGTNSLRYGGADCRVAVWRTPESVVCELRDPGRITDPLVGRLAPPPTATTGRGLWLANHLCDLVQIRSSQDGTVVRLFVDR